MKSAASPPLVLCCSGHDPGGGAGIQADIEAVCANGAHALSLITAHTVQDTQNVVRVVAADPDLLKQQLKVLLADSRPAALKIGLIGQAAQIPLLLSVIRKLKRPVVLDPILRAGGGSNLATAALQNALMKHLLPCVTVLTPNAAEARRLTGRRDLDDCGRALQEAGARHVLITGGDEPGPRVVNHWFSAGSSLRFEWPRLKARFHGAGCTLAAALSAQLAHGLAPEAAAAAAQRYTYRALKHAFRSGRGRRIPGRLP